MSQNDKEVFCFCHSCVVHIDDIFVKKCSICGNHAVEIEETVVYFILTDKKMLSDKAIDRKAE